MYTETTMQMGVSSIIQINYVYSIANTLFVIQATKSS